MASASGSSSAVDLPTQSANPVRQRRAAKVEPVALEDLALAIERQVISVFIDEDMGQQAGAGATALDRA
jgi:hypothetical protein